MIELHERLSEYSYGYGITREVHSLLEVAGIHAVPFLPSLVQEKALGFDVGFGGRGVPLLLQFKLGQSLMRFVRDDTAHPAPTLERPFFRFSINTAEADGQYEALLKAQSDGAEVYYVAPRFDDWAQYVSLFEAAAVLERSILVTPADIRDALIARGSPDGPHRVVYDRWTTHVCSEPIELPHANPEKLAARVAARVRGEGEALGSLVRRIYDGTENRAAIRRREDRAATLADTEVLDAIGRLPTGIRVEEQSRILGIRSQRARWLESLRSRSKSEDDAITAALGLELWGLGIQLLLAVEAPSAA